MVEPFFVKDCTLSVISTGISARSLVELRDVLKWIQPSSLYYHFWGERLRPSFVHPEYHNDFAKWAHFTLHDEILSERLGIIDPTDFNDMDELRRSLLEIIEERLDEIDFLLWSKKEKKFHFLRSITIVFDSGRKIENPIELKKLIPDMTPNSVFYHLIDAKGRTSEGMNDFSTWLKNFSSQYDDLIEKINHIDPFFLTLTEVRHKLTEVVNDYFL